MKRSFIKTGIAVVIDGSQDSEINIEGLKWRVKITLQMTYLVKMKMKLITKERGNRTVNHKRFRVSVRKDAVTCPVISTCTCMLCVSV